MYCILSFFFLAFSLFLSFSLSLSLSLSLIGEEGVRTPALSACACAEHSSVSQSVSQSACMIIILIWAKVGRFIYYKNVCLHVLNGVVYRSKINWVYVIMMWLLKMPPKVYIRKKWMCAMRVLTKFANFTQIPQGWGKCSFLTFRLSNGENS